MTSKLIKLELTSQLSAEQVGHLFQAVGANSDVVELESFLAAATAIQTLLGAVMNDAVAALVEEKVGQALLDDGRKPAGGSSAKAAHVLSAGAEAKAEEPHEAPLPSAQRVIDHCVTEDKIVPRCDAAIKAGADASTAVYDAVHQSVVFTEAEGVKALREELSDQRLTERVGRGGAKAQQTKTGLMEVSADAAAARPLATEVIARAAAACGVEKAAQPPLKATLRMLEKALLRPGASRGLCETVCDCVRDMLTAESAAQLAKLVRALLDDEVIALTLTLTLPLP